MKDHITLRLGALAAPLHAAAEKNGRNLSAEIRARLARSLRVRAPDMQPGNQADSDQARAAAAKAAKARWNRKTQ